MEDEVFNKLFKKLIEEFYPFGAEYYDPDKIEERKKVNIKQILEEIESNAYEKAIKDFNDLADGKIIMKEAKP